MIVRLEDVCIKGTSNIRQKDVNESGRYPVYGAAGPVGFMNSFQYDEPYVGVVKDGAGIGRATYLPSNSSIIGTIQALIPKNNVLPKYLYYAVSSMHLEKYYSGATIPHIYFKNYKHERFVLVSKKEQEQIIWRFSLLEKMISNKQQQLLKLNELIKARFVEMFGDPVNNSKDQPVDKFINIVKLQRGFDLPVKKRDSTGKIPVFGSNGIVGYHTEAKAKNGIITGRSETIGKVYRKSGEYWPLNTSLFSVDTHGNNIIFLQVLMQLFHLERFYNGAGVPTLNRNDVHRQKIIKISLDKQNEFANFVQQVDKSKFENIVYLNKTLSRKILSQIGDVIRD